MEKIRVGFGFDVHCFQAGRELWLGGIKIANAKGLQGHSDADVLIHSLCDALLGAANARDIGFHFPNTSSKFENIDSKILLRQTMDLIHAKDYVFGNADITVCAEKPRLTPYIPRMKTVLSNAMAADADDISIKATTSEKMGYVGREEGIAVYATVLIYKKK
ncbi:MAG: 2-C-methyl-D-erythritol 2,4-cyclodiphosphate synthase [Dysgonamonadaceae bacterium]|jgi:2-C-methyl-D-erythritol 2,4-cyclodiphosphate synthase|nr:2-C-methyl-D-erythritol 2,4-cyclodiphosphate synthase [Dysgonamonadaceae bacterium]